MRILVTAGPTREFLDPVRYLSNCSSGKMGYALAEAALELRHEVALITGPVQLRPPRKAETTHVVSAREMASAVLKKARQADVIIMAAAVADYESSRIHRQKIKKTGERLTLILKRTPDILSMLGKRKRKGQLLVGFAAETDHLERNARLKLERKNLDWIVANDVSREGLGFNSDYNAVTIISRNGESWKYEPATKKLIARKILRRILAG